VGKLTFQDIAGGSFDITLSYPVHMKKAKTLRLVEFGFRIEARANYD